MKSVRLIFITLAALAVLAAGASTAVAGSSKHLDKVLDSQEEDIKARYASRNPKETLEFFGIKPGMTVVEALPGGGWYTKILLPYLGSEGHLIGANYTYEMFGLFGFFNEEQLENLKTWDTDWVAGVNEAKGEGTASVSAFSFGTMPDSMASTADAVLLIRATHNLARFEEKGDYFTNALADINRVLKPGGIVGLVQHEARDGAEVKSDGSAGYLNKAFVIKQMKKAGFELVGDSDINANPKDQPGAEDVVWRLPPGLFTSQDDPELRAKYEAIGESNRMTLKFKKVN